MNMLYLQTALLMAGAYLTGALFSCLVRKLLGLGRNRAAKSQLEQHMPDQLQEQPVVGHIAPETTAAAIAVGAVGTAAAAVVVGAASDEQGYASAEMAEAEMAEGAVPTQAVYSETVAEQTYAADAASLGAVASDPAAAPVSLGEQIAQTHAQIAQPSVYQEAGSQDIATDVQFADPMAPDAGLHSTHESHIIEPAPQRIPAPDLGSTSTTRTDEFESSPSRVSRFEHSLSGTAPVSALGQTQEPATNPVLQEAPPVEDISTEHAVTADIPTPEIVPETSIPESSIAPSIMEIAAGATGAAAAAAAVAIAGSTSGELHNSDGDQPDMSLAISAEPPIIEAPIIEAPVTEAPVVAEIDAVASDGGLDEQTSQAETAPLSLQQEITNTSIDPTPVAAEHALDVTPVTVSQPEIVSETQIAPKETQHLADQDQALDPQIEAAEHAAELLQPEVSVGEPAVITTSTDQIKDSVASQPSADPIEADISPAVPDTVETTQIDTPIMAPAADPVSLPTVEASESLEPVGATEAVITRADATSQAASGATHIAGEVDAASTSDMGVAAAAAVGVAAAATAAFAGTGDQTTEQTSEQVVPGIESVDSVDVPTGMSPDADDLLNIAEIDDGIAQALNGLGITRYDQIANWTAQDVDKYNAEMGVSGRIQRQNWIEQAEILAQGRKTVYSRRRQHGGQTSVIASIQPTADLPGDVAAQAASLSLGANDGPDGTADQATIASVAIGAGDAGEQIVSAVAQQSGAIKRASDASQSGQKQLRTSRSDAADSGSDRAAKTSIVGGIAAAAAAIGTSLIGQKNKDRAGSAGAKKIKPTTGSGDAGATTSRAVTGKAARTMRPAQLSDAIDQNVKKQPINQKTSRMQTGAGQGSDLRTMRSVRSEAFKSTKVGAGASSAQVVSSQLDDLKRVRGVGVLIERRLHALGVTRYEQMANWSDTDIARISQSLDFKGRIERENWVEQARILASGGYTEFSSRVDQSRGDSSKPKRS